MSAASKYFELESLVSEAATLRRRVALQGQRGAANKLMAVMADHPSHWLRSDSAVLTGMNAEVTEAARQHRLFDIVASAHPIETLVEYAKSSVGPSDREVRQMMIFQGEREALLSDRRGVFSVRSHATWLFAAAAIISRTLPREVVQRLGWAYSDYLWWSFCFFAVVLGLILAWKWVIKGVYSEKNEVITVSGIVLALLAADEDVNPVQAT